MELIEFFNICWKEYLKRTPTAKKIFDGLIEKGETVVNDHLALRTFCHEDIDKEKIASYFEDQGMEIRGHYEFPNKHVTALHLEHVEKEDFPKIFISEIHIDKLSKETQKIIQNSLSQVEEFGTIDELVSRKRPWTLSYESYQTVLKESEYAAWLLAYGFFPNHFTVSVKDLKHFYQIEGLNKWIQRQGIEMNESGGLIKGSEKDLLQQSSTMADLGKVEFSDGVFEVRACYYEFAKRYPDKKGKIYQGFIAANADKIFDSTNS